MSRMADGATLSNEELIERVVSLCREKRGEDVVVLDVRGLVDYMDYLVVASGRSERQNRALAEHVIRGVKKAGRIPLSSSGKESGAWICVDLVDVVIHLMTPATRAYYDLELLWGDAEPVEVVAAVAAEPGRRAAAEG